jgi:hypothetical protein
MRGMQCNVEFGYQLSISAFALGPRKTTENRDRVGWSQDVKLIFNNSVRTAKKTPHFTITQINRLTLFKEIIAVYSEILRNPHIQNVVLLTFKADGTYCYH